MFPYAQESATGRRGRISGPKRSVNAPLSPLEGFPTPCFYSVVVRANFSRPHSRTKWNPIKDPRCRGRKFHPKSWFILEIKFMQFKNIIATIAILCSAIFCENANAAMKDPIKYNNWSGGAFFNDKDNSFLACSVGTGFVNGTYFSIGINPSAVTNLGFSSTGWSLKPGAIISGQIKIDGNYFSTFNGVAINNQLVSISFQAGDIIFESLRKGRLLTVTSAIGSASYDLTDTARALSIVKECADKNKSLVRVNYDLQNWLNKNPWFNNPQYQNQKVIALSINSQILSEGGDPFSSKFYDEIDKRLALAGINLGPQSTITDTSDKSAENAKPEADFEDRNLRGLKIYSYRHILLL